LFLELFTVKAVKVTVTKPVWFRVRGLGQVLKPNNLTE